MFTGTLFQIKLRLLSTVLLDGFQSSPKRNCSQDRANFHQSRAWQIVLILTLDNTYIVALCPFMGAHFMFL